MRLAYNREGYSYDAAESPKYKFMGEDAEGNAIWERRPYLGSVAPEEGKRSKKWDNHRDWYAKLHGIPNAHVTDDMLYEEASTAKARLIDLVTEGQDIDWLKWDPDVRIDVKRYPGKGAFGRELISIRNPETGKIIIREMNTPELNAAYDSYWNRRGRK
jgi:hypothetical protein